MNPPWTDEILASMERDYRNHPDVADLIAGVRRVLALHAPTERGECSACFDGAYISDPLPHPCPTVATLNDPNGA